MEKEEKSQRERDFLLQWGNRKRLRCVKLKKDSNFNSNNNVKSSPECLDKKKSTCSRFASPSKDPSSFQQRLNNKSSKEERYYTTRGSMGLDENGGKLMGFDVSDNNKASFVWPKLFISLSSKEKEEDFMAMKGCKPPQRPKKRAKLVQKSLLLVMPGSWLSDLCQERYEVREKKASKKVLSYYSQSHRKAELDYHVMQRPRGLKAMETDSDRES